MDKTVRRIHRYSIPATENQVESVQMRKGGTIVHVDSKSGLVYESKNANDPRVYIDFWVMFEDDEEEFVTRHFIPVTTGKPIDDGLIFVSSVIVKSDDLFGGAIAYHIFEKLV